MVFQWKPLEIRLVKVEKLLNRVLKFSQHPAQVTGYFKHLHRVVFVNYTILFHQS